MSAFRRRLNTHLLRTIGSHFKEATKQGQLAALALNTCALPSVRGKTALRLVFGVDPSDRIANYPANAFRVLFVCGDKFDLTCHINVIQ